MLLLRPGQEVSRQRDSECPGSEADLRESAGPAQSGWEVRVGGLERTLSERTQDKEGLAQQAPRRAELLVRTQLAQTVCLVHLLQHSLLRVYSGRQANVTVETAPAEPEAVTAT